MNSIEKMYSNLNASELSNIILKGKSCNLIALTRRYSYIDSLDKEIETHRLSPSSLNCISISWILFQFKKKIEKILSFRNTRSSPSGRMGEICVKYRNIVDFENENFIPIRTNNNRITKQIHSMLRYFFPVHSDLFFRVLKNWYDEIFPWIYYFFCLVSEQIALWLFLHTHLVMTEFWVHIKKVIINCKHLFFSFNLIRGKFDHMSLIFQFLIARDDCELFRRL